ncbi:MAG TPA: transposase, partial [Candidatus Fimadaptatus faecigallinarum]|nr:transposase [Candidatus Fimadaptatus faecigallinarum]
SNGRPSVDPVSMFKMLLVGYLYGIKSERRLLEEVRLNLAYRWFCGFELHEAIPDHSTFSKTRAEVAAKRSVSEGVSGNCTAMCQKRPCGWKSPGGRGSISNSV